MQFSVLSLLAATLLARSSTGATPDETARFLAGLPMHGSSLEAIAQKALWVEHAMASDDAWRPLEARQLTRIREWAGSFSFFITKEMKTDLTQTQLSGTLPVLLVFLARGGCRVESVETVALNKAGAPTPGKGATNGVKIVFFGPHGEKQTLHYFTADLSDGALKGNPAILKFTESLRRGHSLLKAASYLLHGGGFDSVRDFLLTHSDLLVQDDSGIPLRYFVPARWQLRFFGRYPGPIDIFQQHYQPALAELYRKSMPPPLEFSFGYRWHPRQSGLLLARAQPR